MRSPVLPIVAALSAAVLTVGCLAAQRPDQVGDVGAVVGSPGETPGPGPNVLPDELCLKVRGAADVVFVDGQLHSRTGVDLGPLLAAVGDAAEWVPMVPGVSRELLDAWHARAVATLPPGRAPGHMGHWFYLRCASIAAADRLLATLPANELVEHCYRRPVFTPAGGVSAPTPAAVPAPAQGGGDPAPPTPLFHALQRNLEPAPVGTGMAWANGILGGRGQGVGMRMIEVDWFLEHEDLGALFDTSNFLGTPPIGEIGIANHGTAGASLIVADRNAFGMFGAADEVDIRFIAYPRNGGLSNSILMAAADASDGDVIVMVLMFLLGQLGADDWVPFEFFQAEFDATLTSTANGRIVVATAANGARSLDDPRFFRRFDRSYRDSGAIMIGASDGANLVRAPYSNFGSILDGNSWGEDVCAAGYGTLFYGNLDRRQSYTERYAGTSASVPVIAAAIAAIQGAARRQLARSLTGAEMRALLRAHGTPVTGMIGRRTDVRAIFETLGILDGLELSAPHLLPGEQVQVTLDQGAGAPGIGLLFASLGTGDTNVGLNRNMHLDLATAVTFDFAVLQAGRATFTLAVPNNPLLCGVSLYLQGAVEPSGGPLHVTNSGQVTVL